MAKELTKYIIRVRTEEDINTLIEDIEGWGVQIIKRYSRLSQPTICVAMTGLLVKWFQDDDRIISIEEVKEIRLGTKQLAPPKHLDRIDQRDLPRTEHFTYSSDGTGVVAYVLDSGCYFAHSEFSGRVTSVDDVDEPGKAFDPFFDVLETIPPSSSAYEDAQLRLKLPRGSDEIGHGTHVCGILGSTTYGVAKNVTIKTARVFGDSGFTTSNLILDGIEAIMEDYTNNGYTAAVCNMSFGASGSIPSMEAEIMAMIAAGITVVAAAGNAGDDASNYTPAKLSDVITVGAVDEEDTIANFSNFGNPETLAPPGSTFGSFDFVGTNTGSAVDIFAPGTNVLSTYLPVGEELNSVAQLSGTSMAAPAVAGVAALILENSPGASPASVASDIDTNATTGAINFATGVLAGTPNKLLYSIFVDYTVEWITPSGPLDSKPEGYVGPVDTGSDDPEGRFEAIGFSGNAITYSDVTSGSSGDPGHVFSLPPGATLNSITGRLFLNGGTNGALGDVNYEFTIRASDGIVFADRTFVFRLADAALPPIWDTAENLGRVPEGEPINIQLIASGRNGSSTIVYTPTEPLPYDWQLTPDGGWLSGIAPMVANRDYPVQFTVSAYDGTDASPTERTFTLTIGQRLDFPYPSGEPRWTTGSNLGIAKAGEPYSFTLTGEDSDNIPRPLQYLLEVETANGGKMGPTGELPPGLTLDPNTGVISGTYTGGVDDIYEFAVFLSDGANVTAKAFTITATTTATNILPVWSTPAGLIATIDAQSEFNFTLVATDSDGSPTPLTYNLISGGLPPGIQLNTNSGELTGFAPFVTANSHYTFTIGVTDGSGVQVPRTFAINVDKINLGPEWQTPDGLILEIHEGENLAYALEATDPGGDTLTYSLISGSLPPIVSLNPFTGVLSGPVHDVNATQDFTFTIRVDDSESNTVSETLFEDRTFTIRVLDGPLVTNAAPTWVTSAGALIDATENQEYFTQLVATDPDGGPSPISYVITSGSLPSGLALNQNSGIISGKPNPDANIVDDTFNFTVAAYDGGAFTERSFSIKVIDEGDLNNPPVWVTPSGDLGSFDESVPLSIVLDADDPDGDALTFSVVAGLLPPGLTLSTTGVISGSPNQVVIDTTFVFIVRATDSNGAATERTFSIEILDTANVAPNWITPAGSLGSVSEGLPTLFALLAVDPDSSPNPLTYSVTGGALPGGLTLDTNTGEISGTPDPVAVDTVFAFEITVTDGLASVPRAFTITVTDATVFTGDTTTLSIPVLGDLRNEWRAWNNNAIIPDSVLYQPTNPNFGRVVPDGTGDLRKEPKIYIANNLHTDDPNIIFNVFDDHHMKFDVLFGVPKYAVVRDAGDNIIYEVIYLDIIDPQKGSDFDIDEPGFISKNFEHIRTEILAGIANTDELPDWMTTEQTVGDPDSVIGFKPAVVLAYVLPGTAADIVDELDEISQTLVDVESSPTTFDADTTTFDMDTTTFDDFTETIVVATKGKGHQFVGRQFIIDRYLFETTGDDSRYIKFGSDTPNPIWITQPGLLGEFTIGASITPIVLEAESPVGSDIEYTIVSGNLPDGLTLNMFTGQIAGTPGTGTLNVWVVDSDPMPFDGESRSFIVEAKDDQGRTSISRFKINTVP